MLKLAVIGAQTLLGRELVAALEAREASVLPLSIGELTVAEETGDLVVFAPSSRDVAISADLLAYLDLTADAKAAVLTLGFDPVLWGVLRPTMRVLDLM